MITLRIGEAEREWQSPDDVEPAWIAEQIRRRRQDGLAVCVYTRVEFPGIDIGMVAGECSRSYGSGPPPNEDEARILALWSNRVNRNLRIEPGELVAFFEQLRRLI